MFSPHLLAASAWNKVTRHSNHPPIPRCARPYTLGEDSWRVGKEFKSNQIQFEIQINTFKESGTSVEFGKQFWTNRGRFCQATCNSYFQGNSRPLSTFESSLSFYFSSLHHICLVNTPSSSSWSVTESGSKVELPPCGSWVECWGRTRKWRRSGPDLWWCSSGIQSVGVMSVRLESIEQNV